MPALGWVLEAAHVVRRLDEAGIDRGVVMTIVDAPEVNPNALELVAEACAAYPGRLEAFARIHPWYGDWSLDLLDRAIGELGFKGLKLHPVSTIAHPGGEETLRLIRRAAEHSAPTLFHCGDEPLTTPLTIAHAAAACPEATIILGHMGGYVHADEAIDVAERFPNLMLETSAMPYPAKVRAAVERLGPERVLYASDGPACSPRIELEKVHTTFFTATGERNALLTSQRGTYNSRTSNMIARKNVVVDSQDGRHLTTQELMYNQQRNEISSDSAFVMTEPNRRLEGIGFRSDPDMKNIKILKQVSGVARAITTQPTPAASSTPVAPPRR